MRQLKHKFQPTSRKTMLPKKIDEMSFKGNLVLLKLCGLFPYDSYPKIYTIYAYCFYIVFTLPIPILTTIQLLIQKETDIRKFTDNFFLNVQLGVLILKLLPLKNYPGSVRRTIQWLNVENFRKNSEGKENMVEDCIRTCRRIFFIFFSFCMASLFTWPLKVFFQQGRVLPIDIWLPFDATSDARIFWAIFAYVFIGVANTPLGNSALDTLIAGLIYHAATQLKILKDNLENLPFTVERYLLEESKTVHGRDIEVLKADITYREICSCIAHYDEIYEFVKDLQKTYSFIAFTSFLASILILCISCLQLSIIEPFTVNFYAMVIYIFTELTQIFWYCYYGMVLYEESDSVINSIYMSDWYSYDEKSKKALITLMERAKRPMKVTAGKLLDLSLETFTMIIRRSYSLLAVLKNY